VVGKDEVGRGRFNVLFFGLSHNLLAKDVKTPCFKLSISLTTPSTTWLSLISNTTDLRHYQIKKILAKNRILVYINIAVQDKNKCFFVLLREPFAHVNAVESKKNLSRRYLLTATARNSKKNRPTFYPFLIHR
jgi:hypothetical protein